MQMISPTGASLAMEDGESSKLCYRSTSLPASPRIGQMQGMPKTRSFSLKARHDHAPAALTTRLLAAQTRAPSALLQRRAGKEGSAALKVRAFNTERRSPSPSLSPASCSHNPHFSPPPASRSSRPPPANSSEPCSPPPSASRSGSDRSPAANCSSTPRSLYDALQLKASASQKEILTAGRRLLRQHHPDKVAEEHREASTLLFLEIHSAYTTLKDPHSRARYDLQMSLQSCQSSGHHHHTGSVDLSPSAPFTYPYTPTGSSSPTSPYRYAPPSPSTPYCYAPPSPSTPASPYRYSPRTSSAPYSYTPLGQSSASAYCYTPRPVSTAAAANAYSPRAQVSSNPTTPRSQFATPASPNYTPRSPYSTGRNWETDQCW